MTDRATLKRRYRRLLAWYPRGFRREQADEMLAVLMAGAPPGRTRPGLAEALNLIITGLEVRLRRRRLIVQALACAAALAALGYALVAPKEYTATAEVAVFPTGTDQVSTLPVRTPSPVNMDTEAQWVTSRTVTALAGKLMHSSLTPYQLRKNITVSVPPNSWVLDIACHAKSAAAAATCANDFATAYLQNRKSIATGSLGMTIAATQAQIAQLMKIIASLQEQLGLLPPSSTANARGETTLAADNAQLARLESQVTTLTGQQTHLTVGTMISMARPAA